MCYFCNNKKKIKSCNFGGELKLQIIKDSMRLSGDSGSKIFEKLFCPEFKINYCPMCGKRLFVETIHS